MLLQVLNLLLAAGLSAADATSASIRVPVWVEGANGSTSASDFSAAIAGAPTKVVGVKGPGDDLMLILALDITEDLTQATAAKDALRAALEKLPPRVAVAVVQTQDSLKVLQKPTANRAKVIEAIDSLNVSGKAGLLDTVEFLGKAADAILGKSGVRVAILYITDSDIQNYRENFVNPVVNSSDTRDLSRKFPEALIQERINKLTTRLAWQQTPLFIVHLVYRTDRLNEAYQSGLQQLAETTAGISLFCHSSGEVVDALNKSLITIDQHLSLTLALPEHLPKAAAIQVSLNDSNGARVAASRTQIAIK